MYIPTSKEVSVRSWEATLAFTWMASPMNDCKSGESPRFGGIRPRIIQSVRDVLTFFYVSVSSARWVFCHCLSWASPSSRKEATRPGLFFLDDLAKDNIEVGDLLSTSTRCLARRRDSVSRHCQFLLHTRMESRELRLNFWPDQPMSEPHHPLAPRRWTQSPRELRRSTLAEQPTPQRGHASRGIRRITHRQCCGPQRSQQQSQRISQQQHSSEVHSGSYSVTQQPQNQPVFIAPWTCLADNWKAHLRASLAFQRPGRLVQGAPIFLLQYMYK